MGLKSKFKKAVGAIKKAAVGSTSNIVKTAVGAAAGPVALFAPLGSKAAGKKTDMVFNPLGNVAGEATEYTYEKPLEAKKLQKELDAADAAAQAAMLAGIKQQEAQSSAEKEAADKLLQGRMRQEKKKSARGRSSTILAGGSLGGDSSILGS